MKINSIIITGTEELAGKIKGLFASAGFNVTRSDDNFTGADLVIEALAGDIETKKRALHAAEKQVSEKAIFATTAFWGITEISATIKRPQRFVGMNFTFNPSQTKCLVQMVKGLETSEETIQICKSLLEKSGATVVQVEDSPGLILDRVMAMMINEAADMHASKLASVEDIDMAMKLCANWPMGPFEFADTIGIDNVVATLAILSQQLGQQYLPCRLLRQMVAAGQLGKKTGRGFYNYK